MLYSLLLFANVVQSLPRRKIGVFRPKFSLCRLTAAKISIIHAWCDAKSLCTFIFWIPINGLGGFQVDRRDFGVWAARSRVSSILPSKIGSFWVQSRPDRVIVQPKSLSLSLLLFEKSSVVLLLVLTLRTVFTSQRLDALSPVPRATAVLRTVRLKAVVHRVGVAYIPILEYLQRISPISNILVQL